MSTFEDWQEGLVPDMDALRVLCSDLGEVESDLAPLQEQREALRAQIGEVVARRGEAVEIAGFGRIEIAPAAIVRGYDKRRLDALLVDLAGEAPEVARRLAECRTETARAGSLRITREK